MVQDKREAVVADITRQLDAMENRSMPKVTVSSMVIHVPDVVYAIPATRTITVENVGDVSATWRFVPKPEEKWFAKTWLSVEPAYGLIPPGGTATITLTITVDDAVARDISLGREVALQPLGAAVATGGSGGGASAAASSSATGGSGASSSSSAAGGGGSAAAGVTAAAVGGLLEDVLILRMERGRDYYLSVSASVLPTCFGCSLSQLARRPEPMRALAVTSTATAALHAAAGLALGVSPPVSAAALAGGAAGSSGAPAAASAGGGGATGTASVKPIPPAVDFAAGSHTLAARLASDEIDVHLPSVAAAALAAPSDPFSFSASAVSFPSPAGAASSPAGGGSSGGIFGAPSASSSSDASRKGSALMSVPKEVWRLVDVIFTR